MDLIFFTFLIKKILPCQLVNAIDFFIKQLLQIVN